MAPQTASQSFTTLRVLTQRLASTPSWQLPHIVPHLASTISSCKDLFCRSETLSQAKSSSEDSVLVHKFKTRISALLHDKNSQAKWAAVILVKATIEVGGWEILRASGGWIRGLLDILGKPEPESTKVLCIITLTRIFFLAQTHQSIMREIVIPSLPSFITSGLNVLKAQQSVKQGRATGTNILSSTVLRAFCALLPYHPSLFRPFVSQTRDLILPLIAPTPSSIGLDALQGSQVELHGAAIPSISEPARRLYVLLSACAPKNTSGEEWVKSLHALINTFHRTADHVFRAVIEDWEPASIRLGSVTNTTKQLTETVGDLEQDPLGLPGWKNIYAGMERLDGLIQTMKIFLSTPTSTTVAVPVTTVIDAVSRVFFIVPPSKESLDELGRGTRIKAEIGRDEREGLWTELPRIHVSALELLSILISRLGHGSMALCHGILEQALWLFESELASSDIRRTTYDLISNILSLVGVTLSKPVSPSLSKCVRRCCEDVLLPTENLTTAEPNSKNFSKNPSANGAPSNNADSYFKSPVIASPITPTLTKVQMSASNLLPLTLSSVPRDLFPRSLRAQIDRTAILSNHKQAMLASVLNPPTKQINAPEMSSIMPFIARQVPASLEVEALIRPRMPLLHLGRGSLEDVAFNGAYDLIADELEEEMSTVESERMEAEEDFYHQTAERSDDNTMTDSERIHSDHVPTLVPQPPPPKKRERAASPPHKRLPDPTSTETANPHTFTPTSPSFHKRARLEEANTKPSNDANQDTTSQDTNTVQPSTSAPTNAPHPAPQLPLQTMATAVVGEDSDTDDNEPFEIPRIDIGMDTHDEDEEDEEGRGTGNREGE